jgi:hypothetical protein
MEHDRPESVRDEANECLYKYGSDDGSTLRKRTRKPQNYRRAVIGCKHPIKPNTSGNWHPRAVGMGQEVDAVAENEAITLLANGLYKIFMPRLLHSPWLLRVMHMPRGGWGRIILSGRA